METTPEMKEEPSTPIWNMVVRRLAASSSHHHHHLFYIVEERFGFGEDRTYELLRERSEREGSERESFCFI
jgi:hypothetical protein